MKEQLTALAGSFQKWWRNDGFGYVKEMRFTQHGGFEAELGITFHRSYLHSHTPSKERQSKAEWEASLHDKGYKIYQNKNGGDQELIDCPENRELLTKLIEERFPSALIDSWVSQLIYQAEGHVYEIHALKVYIRELADLKVSEEESIKIDNA